jgi:hypothetical protein
MTAEVAGDDATEPFNAHAEAALHIGQRPAQFSADDRV